MASSDFNNVCGLGRVEDNLPRCSLRWNPTIEKLWEAPKVQIISTCLWSEGLSFTAITQYEIICVISFVLFIIAYWLDAFKYLIKETARFLAFKYLYSDTEAAAFVLLLYNTQSFFE